MKIQEKIMKKKFEKKNFEKKKWKFWKKFFGLFSILKGPESGKEKNRKSGIRTFQNLPDFRTGRDVRLSPNYRGLIWLGLTPAPAVPTMNYFSFILGIDITVYTLLMKRTS